MFPPIVRTTFGLNFRGSLLALTIGAGLINNPPVAAAGSNPGSLTFGPPDALHVVVAGNGTSGYHAQIYDGNQLVPLVDLLGNTI
jgi:hypothetical protein